MDLFLPILPQHHIEGHMIFRYDLVQQQYQKRARISPVFSHGKLGRAFLSRMDFQDNAFPILRWVWLWHEDVGLLSRHAGQSLPTAKKARKAKVA